MHLLLMTATISRFLLATKNGNTYQPVCMQLITEQQQNYQKLYWKIEIKLGKCAVLCVGFSNSNLAGI